MKYLTTQEMFDRAARGILAQGEASMTADGDCRYRGPGQLRCAVGWILDDDHYTSSMEEVTVLKLRKQGFCLPWHPRDDDLAIDLQNVHDLEDVEMWPDRLRTVAERHHLSAAVVDEFG